MTDHEALFWILLYGGFFLFVIGIILASELDRRNKK